MGEDGLGNIPNIEENIPPEELQYIRDNWDGYAQLTQELLVNLYTAFQINDEGVYRVGSFPDPISNTVNKYFFKKKMDRL